tara:strand:- start:22 stop:282 length:261 start_codon:yes stop_codon:yes gene_type:complete
MKNKKGETMKINDLVWIKQRDYSRDAWVLGRVKGFTKKMIKCEDLFRPEITQDKNGVGNFLPKNVQLITEQEIKERNFEKLIQERA